MRGKGLFKFVHVRSRLRDAPRRQDHVYELYKKAKLGGAKLTLTSAHFHLHPISPFPGLSPRSPFHSSSAFSFDPFSPVQSTQTSHISGLLPFLPLPFSSSPKSKPSLSRSARSRRAICRWSREAATSIISSMPMKAKPKVREEELMGTERRTSMCVRG